MPLTPKQARFVAEYSVDMNATQAAIRAGYSEQTAAAIGYENLRKPEIASALAITQAKVTSAVLDSAQDVLHDALEAYQAAMAAGQFGAAVSALNLRAKRHPEFSEKHEVTGDVRLRVEALAAIATMTPEQMKALAEGVRE